MWPRVRRNCFLSYTETDEKDVSLLLDATLLAHFRQAIQHLPGVTIGPQQPPGKPAMPHGAPSPIQLIGFPLRAIQVLEGYGGHVDAAIITSVSGTLAAAHFSIFYVSTNHADYVLVQEQQLEAVLTCLADKFLLIKEEMEGDDEDEDASLSHTVPFPDDHQHEERKVSPQPPIDDDRRRSRKPNSAAVDLMMEDEERMIREALRRSKRKHKNSLRRANGEAEAADGGTSLMDEGIAGEDSEGEEWSSTKESQSAMTPPTSTFLSSTPLSPSPALSALSLSSSQSFSSVPTRPLQLQAMPYSLVLHSLAPSDLPSFFSSLLQLIFFPSTPLTCARFFSYTMIDSDYSLITTPPQSMPSLPASLHQQLTHSQQWSVIEALGVFRYDEAGLVSRISRPLSDAGLRFFYFSSWRTGFVIVHKEDEERAKEALRVQFELVA